MLPGVKVDKSAQTNCQKTFSYFEIIAHLLFGQNKAMNFFSSISFVFTWCFSSNSVFFYSFHSNKGGMILIFGFFLFLLFFFNLPRSFSFLWESFLGQNLNFLEILEKLIISQRKK